jgi:hypothetical protein
MMIETALSREAEHFQLSLRLRCRQGRFNPMKTLHAVQQSGDNPSELKPDGPRLILSSLFYVLPYPNEARAS